MVSHAFAWSSEAFSMPFLGWKRRKTVHLNEAKLSDDVVSTSSGSTGEPDL